MNWRWKNWPLFAADTRGELRTFQIIALAGIAFAFLVPQKLDAISLCYFYNITGLPCPGCGLTRSVTRTLHLDPASAFFLNPFGSPIAVGMAFFAASAFVRPLAAWFEARRRGISYALLVGGLALLAFGVARFVTLVWFPEYAFGFDAVLHERRLFE